MGAPLDDLRATVRATPGPPTAMASYLEKVRAEAYRITDDDVAPLLAEGFTEDEIFEQTIAVAIAEGLRRLDAAERVIG